MTPPVTQGRDAWSVPDIEALRPLAPRRSRRADVLLHRRRLVTAAVAFPGAVGSSAPPYRRASEVGASWWALLALTATLGSLALATYVPLARRDQRRRQPVGRGGRRVRRPRRAHPPLTLIILSVPTPRLTG